MPTLTCGYFFLSLFQLFLVLSRSVLVCIALLDQDEQNKPPSAPPAISCIVCNSWTQCLLNERILEAVSSFPHAPLKKTHCRDCPELNLAYSRLPETVSVELVMS